MNELLLNQIKNNKLANSYLLISSDIEESLEWFGQLKSVLKVKQVDIFTIETDSKIKIEQIRKLQQAIKLKPHSSSYKLFYLSNCDNLGNQSANALLKTLEESPSNSIIVLAATNSAKILPTITSRCQKVFLNKTKSYASKSDKGSEIDKIKNMKYYQRFEYAKQLVKNDQINACLEGIIADLKKNLTSKNNRELLKKIIYYQYLITETNSNKQLVLENLFLVL